MVTYAVNMGPRLSPQLSPTDFRNLVLQGIAQYDHEGSCRNDNEATTKIAPELSEQVAEVGRMLSEFKNVEFLSKLQGEKRD